MNRLLCGLVFLAGGLAPLAAQTPAQPVDPNQPLPAQPVEPISPVPAPSSTATNLPPAVIPGPATVTTTVTPVAEIAVSVAAESSLKLVLQELAQSWADTQNTGPQVPLTLTNSGTLRTKVEGGTVWDVVIGADLADMKEMTDKGLLLADGQRSLARNTLVVYGRNPLIKDDDLEWFDLIGSEWKKVALGNPDMVASGRVAKRALQKHDLAGDDKKSVFVYAGTEALALGVAQREQADAVILYKTDVTAGKLNGFEIFPIKTEDAPPIFYLGAISPAAKNPAQARAFLDYCSGDAAKEIWKKYGFETN
jgi:molybdate transport system substrate-binding protein